MPLKQVSPSARQVAPAAWASLSASYPIARCPANAALSKISSRGTGSPLVPASTLNILHEPEAFMRKTHICPNTTGAQFDKVVQASAYVLAAAYVNLSTTKTSISLSSCNALNWFPQQILVGVRNGSLHAPPRTLPPFTHVV